MRYFSECKTIDTGFGATIKLDIFISEGYEIVTVQWTLVSAGV